LGDALENLLVVNGRPAAQAGANYLRVNYGYSYDPDRSKLASLITFAPHIVFVLGFNEGPDVFFKDVEARWMPQNDGHRPFWVFSDGGQVSSLWTSTSGPADLQTEDERQRVSGTVLGFTPSAWSPMGAFLSAFSAKYPSASGADALGPAGAYDILYLLAYSAVLAKDHPLTGANLVTYGLTQMKKTPGLPSIQIGPTGIAAAFPLLASGMPVNVTGASGPLPFDGKGDVQTGDVQVWCVPPKMPPGGDVGSAAVSSGLFFDSTLGQLAGSIGGQCSFP
jgi:hypothetical protein